MDVRAGFEPFVPQALHRLLMGDLLASSIDPEALSTMFLRTEGALGTFAGEPSRWKEL